ncbi:hypothetical protein K2X83_02985 [Patescibacteria group bacterium]|nr:hypothetical protein [Patescibacteria group bacterium]
MITGENVVIIVRGQLVKKGALVDVWWRETHPVMGIKKRRALSLVHQVGQDRENTGFLVTDGRGKVVPVVTRDVSDIRVIKRAQ